MNAIKGAIREIIGLFIEDGFLALATLAIVGFAAILLKATAGGAIAGELTLPVGCLVVLVLGVWRTAAGKRRI
jgi:hypothetical protein